MNDAYSLLGLSPGVSRQDVKRAFRRLAMHWHPDRNPDPAAQDHFRALRAAYENLIAGQQDVEEIVQEAPQPQRPRGADRRQDLALDLEEAFLGCEKPVRLARDIDCEACGGSGEEHLTHSRLCEHCHGSGRVRAKGGLQHCEACDGRGYRTRRPCSTCLGSGRTQAGRTLAVKVPPGLLTGDELRIVREGEPSPEAEGEPGDLRLRISLNTHALYRLDGRDLRLVRPVSALRLLSGGELTVPTLAGPVVVHIEAGSAAPRELRIENAGYPSGRGQPAGALVVELQPMLPEDCDPQLRRLIAELDAELSRKSARYLPELARWEASWLGRKSASPRR
ncbi:MAG: DnaJ domain-containing protein [Thauera sp.]|nr:DnaJ domain-containing protein [Thauera sp.]